MVKETTSKALRWWWIRIY